MKRSIITSGLFAVSLFSSAAWAGSQGLTETYDIEKINEALRKAAANVTFADGPVSDIEIQIDPSRTDFAKDIMGFDGSLMISKVSFQADPVTIKAKGDIRVIQPTATLTHGGIEMRVKADVSADPVGFMKFAMSKHNLCDKAKEKKGVERLIADAHCVFSQQVLAAKSVDDIKNAFINMRSNLISSLSQFVTNSRNEVATIQNNVLREELESALKRGEAFLKIAEEAKLVETADGFTAEVGKMSLLEGLVSLDRAQISLGASMVHLEKDVTLNAGAMFFNAAKPELKAFLKGLEAQEDCAIRIATAALNFKVNLVDEFVK